MLTDDADDDDDDRDAGDGHVNVEFLKSNIIPLILSDIKFYYLTVFYLSMSFL